MLYIYCIHLYWFHALLRMMALFLVVNMPECTRNGPLSTRCCEHRANTGPIMAHYGIFSGLTVMDLWCITATVLWRIMNHQFYPFCIELRTFWVVMCHMYHDIWFIIISWYQLLFVHWISNIILAKLWSLFPLKTVISPMWHFSA